MNQLLGMGGRSERILFATTFVMVVDRESRMLRWSSAGHNPSLVRNPSSGEYARLAAAGVPLGITEDCSYETDELAIAPGTFVTLYTDGLVEARDLDGVEFGLDRVIELVESYQGRPVIASTQAMITAIQGHTRGSPYRRDDVAILNMRIL